MLRRFIVWAVLVIIGLIACALLLSRLATGPQTDDEGTFERAGGVVDSFISGEER